MVLFVIGIIGLLLVGCTPSPSLDLKAVLIERVQAEIAPVSAFTPTGVCGFSLTEKVAFETAQHQALRELLASPDIQTLSLAELEQIFEAAVPQSLGVDLIDQQQGYILVNLYPLYCKQSSRSNPSPDLYVFSRTGEIWHLIGSSGNKLEEMQWLEDRWVGWVHWGGDSLYTFVHLLRVDGVWSRLEFAEMPGLQTFSTHTPEMVYRRGWQEITVLGGESGVSNPPPCDFGDNLSRLESQLPINQRLEVLNTVYRGELTYLWTDT